MSNSQSTAVPNSQREGTATQPTVPEVQKQTILDYLKAFGLVSELTEAETLQFIEIAQAFRLNPFKREIHVAVFGEGEYRNLSIITGYEVYLKRAERTGKLDGWRAWIEGEGEQTKALVEMLGVIPGYRSIDPGLGLFKFAAPHINNGIQTDRNKAP